MPYIPAVPDVLNSTPVSLLVFKAELLYESFEDPENERFKVTTCHRSPRPRTSCISQLFRYYASKQSCSTSHVNQKTCDSTRFCDFETPLGAQIGPLQPKSRNLTKTHHVRKSWLPDFSKPSLWRDTPLGTKYSSNDYLRPF